MTSLSRASQIIVQGIEFYVSDDGSQEGMSQVGLARLCGVTDQAIRRLVNEAQTKDAKKAPRSGLEGLQNKQIYLELDANNNARIINSELCAIIISYYATFANVPNDIAKYSLAKFATIGIKAWIHNVTGFKTQSGVNIEKMFAALMAEMQEMKQLTKEYYNIRENTKLQPGLDDLLDSYKDSKAISDGSYFTLKAWTKAKGLELNRSDLIKLGQIVSRTFLHNSHKTLPKMVAYKCGDILDGGDPKKSRGKVNVYTLAEIPLLESALKGYLANR